MSTLQNTPPISRATASPPSSFTSNTATFAPAAASACALARPSPEAAPVTTAAVVLSIFMALFLFLPEFSRLGGGRLHLMATEPLQPSSS